MAARALGLAHDLETFGSELFRNGSRPSGILSTDQKLTAEQLADMTKSWNDNQSSVANAHKTAILGAGLTFQPLQTTADDAQFIESRRYQTEEICRIMRVDPLMVQQSTNTASYGSIEQRFLAHLTHTLAPWYQRIEQSAECNLLTPAEQRDGYRVILDTRSLTLSVALDRAQYYGQMRQNGLMTINECRDHAGLDRSDDPLADKLTPSANLFGVQPNDAQPKPSV
jgi:HK97 family phage portal protein